MTEEDEAFNYIERQSMWRKRAVAAAIATASQREQLLTEIAILTELVRVLSGRVAELEGKK
jgi:hypothetical protein